MTDLKVTLNAEGMLNILRAAEQNRGEEFAVLWWLEQVTAQPAAFYSAFTQSLDALVKTSALSRDEHHQTFNGGWEEDAQCLQAFHHGMDTVFNGLDKALGKAQPDDETQAKARRKRAAASAEEPKDE